LTPRVKCRGRTLCATVPFHCPFTDQSITIDMSWSFDVPILKMQSSPEAVAIARYPGVATITLLRTWRPDTACEITKQARSAPCARTGTLWEFCNGLHFLDFGHSTTRVFMIPCREMTTTGASTINFCIGHQSSKQFRWTTSYVPIPLVFILAEIFVAGRASNNQLLQLSSCMTVHCNG
jgi:hypothetical protein